MLKSVVDDAMPVDGPALTSALQEPIKKSLAELDELLKETEPDWQDKGGRECGESTRGDTALFRRHGKVQKDL